MVVARGQNAWPVADPAFVATVQRQLALNGYNPGRTDGISDARVESSLRRFQRDRGLPATGAIDRATARELGLDWGKVRAQVRSYLLEPM
jgi:carboxyl-terminal processing protease